MGPLDRGGEAEALGRRDHIGRVAFFHREGGGHPVDHRLPFVLHQAASVQQLQVGLERPVQDGRLGAVHLDEQVVQLQGADRGEEVLYGVDGERSVPDCGAALGGLHLLDPRGNLRGAGQIHPPKADAGAGVGGAAAHGGHRPGVEARAGQLDRGGDGASSHRTLGPWSPAAPAHG